MSVRLHPLTPAPLCLLIAIAFPVQAQQSAAPTSYGNVLITAPAERPLPANSANLSAADLAARLAASSDTASLLRDAPGVSLYGAGGVSSLPAIHGLADDRVRIKVDGMDLIASCPNHMNPALSYVDPTNIGTLKVYAGITPVSVGGDSIAGTIVAGTVAPVFAADGQGSLVKGEAGAFYRSNGRAQGANLSATYATESLSLSYAGAMAKADNYEAAQDFKSGTVTGRAGHELSRDEVGSTAYDTRNHTLGLALKSGNHLIEAKVGFQDMPYQLYPNQRMDLLDNTQHRLNLRYLGHFNWGTVEARAYHEIVDHFMDFGADKRFWYGSLSGAGAAGSPCAPIRFMGDSIGTCAGGMPMSTESKTSGATLKASIVLSQQDMLHVGGELQRYRLNDWWPASGGGMGPGTFWNVNNGQRDRTALFGEWEKRFDVRWATSLGARFERVATDAGAARGYTTMGTAGNQVAEANAFNAKNRDKSDNNWDLAALARYTPSTTQSIEFGFARKVRSPNLHERYTWSSWPMAATMNNFVGDGNGYVGNPDLKPEIAHTLAATFDWHATDRNWEIKATPYYTRVSDYIDAVRTTTFGVNQFNVLAYANQSARLYGLDLSGHMPLLKTGLGSFGLKGVLTYTNGTNRDTGDDLYNIMPLNTRLTLTHTQGGWDNGLELVAVAHKNKVSDVRNEMTTPGYSLVNLRASYSWTKVRVDFGVENLFDRFYSLPLGGAYTGQGRTMSMNPTDGTMAWGVVVPGMGRSIYTGINVKF
ncbi:MAG TPA: TonB-dependent receptor [Rhodocyclaceae bacterium]|nr:TonB-dependent receptor [Rhodocyclaceae bacterium]